MERSESLLNLFSALSKFQSQVSGASKKAKNPHLNSKYADLAEIWKTIKKPLADNGLSVSQIGRESASDNIIVETILGHESGEWISGVMSLSLVMYSATDKCMVLRNDPQSAGSAITYARRYGLAAILGIHQEDDDANTLRGEASKETLNKLTALCNQKLSQKNIDVVMVKDFTERIAYAKKMREDESLNVILAQLDNYPDIPNATFLKKECAEILQKLIDGKIDNYDVPDHRSNSIKHHLSPSLTLNDCTDTDKLLAYKTHLQSVYSASLGIQSPAPTAGQIAHDKSELLISIVRCNLTGEEKEDLQRLVNSAKTAEDLEAVRKSLAGAK